ncbi:putative caffeoyl-CoA O-methyltransferase 1 [Escovopsis weberi]|uniref:Putative caffeoyl-CoA O-methyltransferase 1 n=1 Tax=Escovopsis weberi TaxID=150374 RepID=A0A0M8N7S0_ESCWE|nr:putative caffeoyl-CoA O-methyltransferase 1 [Escovopsis weberi]
MASSSSSPNPVEAPSHVHALLERLHRESTVQEDALGKSFLSTIMKQGFDDLMRDKFIALDQDKAHFVYQLVRALGARNVVEVGTSFGVSTIYLALAVGSNIKAFGGEGKVIATEWEESKAQRAIAHWDEAGRDLVARHIELRQGDCLETLKEDIPTPDVILFDIWAPIALPVLRILEPRMRPGTVILMDNTIAAGPRYQDLFDYMRVHDSPYTNMTLPYSGGFDMCIRQ